ncbi:MAG: TonB-dependent receptor, partial [Phycisphaerales bacterium]|nr:TonB-dependent receptor [Phycisphaerales bacterium]
VQPNGEANYAIGIRGAANSDFTTNQESPVSIYVDEVYISQMSGAGFMLFDMERVEILRGPQGTLYGRNATGGLAHYVTRKPQQAFDGYGQVTVGEYDQVKFQGAIGGGITDTLSGRLSVATHHNSGYVENRLLDDDINNANDYAGRGQLLFTPNEDLSILFNVRGSLQQIRTGFFENVSSRDFDGDGLGELTPELTNFNGYRDGDGDVYAGDYNKFGHNDLKTTGVSGTVKWDFERFTLTSISDYQTVKRDYIEDSDASPFSDFNFYLVTDAAQWSQELRLNGELDRMRWVAGFYYLNITIDDANGAEIPLLGLDPTGVFTGGLFPAPGGDFTGLQSNYQTDKNSWSLFGQLEYDFTDKFTGIAGFRWIDEYVKDLYISDFVFFPNNGTPERHDNPNVLAQLGNYAGKFDKGLWSAKVELDYRPNDDWLLYVSWNRGVKGGGFNAPFDPTTVPAFTDPFMAFDEEVLNAFEGGFKSTLWGGLARLNGSVYYYDYTDFQAFDIVGLATLVQNADADSIGFELELQANPFEGLDLLLGVGYNDMDVTLASGVKTTSVQSPKLNFSGLARYEWPAFGGSMAIQGDFNYRSKHYFSLTRAETVTEDGYVVANARLSWTNTDRRWEAAVFVNNFTDEEYLVQTFDVAGVLGWTEQYYGRPRWVAGSVRYTWD